MKKVLKFILFGLILCLILFAILVIYEIKESNKQEQLLNNEVNNLLKLDLTIDNVSKDIVTRDEYGVIEKTIKDYLRNYSDNIKTYKNSISNFNFTDMFSADNFSNDGPDFIESKSKLSNLKNSLNTSLDNLIKYSNEDYIMNLINSKNIDSTYVSMYKNYMIGNGNNNFNDTLKNEIDDLKKSNELFNIFLDDCYKLYDFMSTNRNYWSVNREDNIVYFENNDLIKKYNTLLNNIIKSASALSNNDNSNNNEKNDNNIAGSL